MQYRIQFLDGEASVIRELSADARNAVGAVELVTEIDWPARAVSIRVLDLDGREVHSAIKVDASRGNGASALKWPRRSCLIVSRA
jgi:hypothetical protein